MLFLSKLKKSKAILHRQIIVITMSEANKQIYSKVNEDSYEKILLMELSSIDNVLVKSNIKYAIFGGCGIAAYIGHFPRKMRDVDIIIYKNDHKKFISLLKKLGYNSRESKKGTHIHFDKRIGNHEIEIHAVFEDFILIDSNNHPITKYSFRNALEHCERLTLKSMDSIFITEIPVISIEEIMITKLFPPLEPTNVHDLLYILLNNKIDCTKFVNLLKTSGDIKILICNRLHNFINLIKDGNIIWVKFNLSSNIKKIHNILGIIYESCR